jgi:hypothetical protein
MEKDAKRICNWDECATKQALLIIIGQYLTPYEALPLRRTFKALNELLKSREYWLNGLVQYYTCGVDKLLARRAMIIMFDSLELTEENYHHLLLWELQLDRVIVQYFNRQMGHPAVPQISPRLGCYIPRIPPDWNMSLSLRLLWAHVNISVRKSMSFTISCSAPLHCLKLAIVNMLNHPSPLVECGELYAAFCENVFYMDDSVKHAILSEGSWFEGQLTIMKEIVKRKPLIEYKWSF